MTPRCYHAYTTYEAGSNIPLMDITYKQQGGKGDGAWRQQHWSYNNRGECAYLRVLLRPSYRLWHRCNDERVTHATRLPQKGSLQWQWYRTLCQCVFVDWLVITSIIHFHYHKPTLACLAEITALIPYIQMIEWIYFVSSCYHHRYELLYRIVIFYWHWQISSCKCV